MGILQASTFPSVTYSMVVLSQVHLYYMKASDNTLIDE